MDKKRLLQPDNDQLSRSRENLSRTGSVNSLSSRGYDSSMSSAVSSNLNGSTTSSYVPVHAYGATALSASGRSASVMLTEFDPFPVNMVCPNCQQAIETNIKYKAGKVTFLTSLLVGVLTCGLGCFLIPCCVKILKDVYHYCPRCNSTIGVYRRKAPCTQ